MLIRRCPETPAGLILLALVGWALWSGRLEAQDTSTVVSGLESERFIEARVEGDLILLRTADGRLYSVARSDVDLKKLRIQTRPFLEELIELLQAGVSETLIRAYVETQWSQGHLRLSKDDVLRLRNAGASDGLVEYLLRRAGRVGKTTIIRWHTPSRPPRGEVAPRQPRTAAPEAMEAPRSGIPYHPYVLPGFGAYVPYVPVYGYGGYGDEGFGESVAQNQDVGQPGPQTPQGYYWPRGRSISGRASRGQRALASPRFRAGPRGSRGGPGRQRGGTRTGTRGSRRTESASQAPTPRGPARGRASGSAWSGRRGSVLSHAPARRGSSGSPRGRSLAGSGSSSRSRSGRSLGNKK